MNKNLQAPTFRFVFDRKHIATTSKANGRRKGTVQIEIYWNRKRKYISTGVSVYSDQWASGKDKHVVSCVNAQEYNVILDKAMNALIEKVSSAGFGNYDFIFNRGIELADISVVDACEEYIGFKKRTLNTRRAYSGIVSTMRAYGKFGSMKNITASALMDFDNYMSKVMDLSGTTRRAAITFVKSVCKYAVLKGYISTNPVALYKMPQMTTRQRAYLTQEHLDALSDVVVPEGMEKSKDMFLFQCYTGLAFVDLLTLERGMFINEHGRWYITRKREKTGVGYRIMLLKPALEIALKYRFDFGTLRQPTYDRHLKRIGKLIGFPHNLSSHIGRHTFATWALSNGVPIEIVSKMLGHTNINTTQIYAKILAKDVENQFSRLDKLF